MREDPPQVHVFWDWDNKYAVHTPPAELVANLRAALQPVGEVAGICAYGNTHTFAWVPPVERARRQLFFKRCDTPLAAHARSWTLPCC